MRRHLPVSAAQRNSAAKSRKAAALLLLSSSWLGWAPQVLAQTVTNITPSAGAANVATMISSGGGVTTIDGGTAVGSNLFHSFNTFDLGSGQTAAWVRTAGDGSSFGNVISRVTGGGISHLQGTLDSSALPNAAFFFINPAGVMIGSGFQANIPTSLHISTANELRFGGGAYFSATTPSGSALTSAAPESFGFLGGQSGDVTFGFGSVGGSVQLNGLDVDISARNIVFDELGLQLVNNPNAARFAAVGNGAVALRLNDPLPAGLTGSFDSRNAVIWSRILSNAGGVDGGLALSAGAISFAGTQFGTSAFNTANAGDITILGNSLLLNGVSHPLTVIFADTHGSGTGGDVLLSLTGALTSHYGFLQSITDAAGNAGSVAISAQDILLTGGSAFRVTTEGNLGNTHTGNAGALALTVANTLRLDDSFVLGDANRTSGLGGNVTVTARTVELHGSAIASSCQYCSSAGGNVVVTANDVRLLNTSFISAVARNSMGAPGAPSAPIVGLPTTGDAGDVTLNIANSLTLIDGHVAAQTEFDTSGNAGNITINAQNAAILIDGPLSVPTSTPSDSGIQSVAVGSGAGGDITISARTIEMLNHAMIRADCGVQCAGGGGNVNLAIGERLRLDGAFITATANLGSTGDAGNVIVNAPNALIEVIGDGRASIVGARPLYFEAINDRIEGNAGISSSTDSSGNAGVVDINARELRLTGGGFRGERITRIGRVEPCANKRRYCVAGRRRQTTRVGRRNWPRRGCGQSTRAHSSFGASMGRAPSAPSSPRRLRTPQARAA